MIRNWGVRARVMLVAVLPMLVLAVLMTALYTSLRITDLDQALTDRGRAFARQLAAASEYAVFSGDREALQQLASTVMGEEDVIGVRIVGHDGNTLVNIGRFDARLPALAGPGDLHPVTIKEGRTLRLVEPIRATKLQLDDLLSAAASQRGKSATRNSTLGLVTVDLSLDRLQRRRGELLWTGILSVLFVLSGSLLLAGYMSRGVSGPIRRVADTALRLGQGRLHERVAITGGGSLRKLAEGINEMAERLAEVHEHMARKIEEATAELRTRKDEAENANLAKSRFLAAASHDLRQPMHALGLFIAELDQQPLAPRAHELARHIAAAAEAMDNLLDSLLDISRLDAGVLRPAPRPFNLQPLLERIVTGQRPAAADRGLTLVLRPGEFWARSDPVLLERIVANLVSNAVRYTPHGTILVACRRRGERVRIEVRDSGVGIPSAAQEIVFQEFVQLDNAERSRNKGLGLGLAIVRRLADLLDHRLELRSAPGRGAVFAVELPLAEPEAKPSENVDERPPGDLGGVRIALLDDDPLARDGTRGLLASWGCEVLSTETVEELRAALAPGDWRPALLISDFRLGGKLNGIDLIGLLRSPDQFPALPAILLSGDTGPETLAAAQQAGIVLLHKPVRPARLRALIHRMLNAAD